ncbi:heparinase II/III domain-containing protein [Massilia sp. SM-13]|uniref:heparinase II/III domain-containing protein n=1 Tax=Pseudoduganella rhizocola TaxID=3382643 RepID=UPI0038B66638
MSISRCWSALLLLLLLGPAFAQMPGPVKPGHPRLYITLDDITRLKAGVFTPALDPGGGHFIVKFTPGAKIAGTDNVNLPVVGPNDEQGPAFVIRHEDGADTAGRARIVVSLRSGAGQVGVKIIDPELGDEVVVALYWRANGTADLTVDGETVALNVAWQPSPRQLMLLGRRNDQFNFIELSDANGVRTPVINRTAHENWFGLIFEADQFVKNNAKCMQNPPAGVACDAILSEGRNQITAPARILGLAYLLTDSVAEKARYADAAKLYALRLDAAPRNAGAAWSMSARIGAMGLLFDYVYEPMGDLIAPGSPFSYRAKLANAIRETARAAEMAAVVCGPNNPLTSNFTCTTPVAFTTPYAGPNTARSYISGHMQSDAFGAALGLLAIVDEQSAVKPMIDTIYNHFKSGFVPAWKQIAVHGGYHTGYAYGSVGGEVAERLLMWERVVAPGSVTGPMFDTSWLSRIVFPYIYALRADGFYPASSDSYGLTPGNEAVGQLALVAAKNGTPEGLSFYKEEVLPRRAILNAHSAWEDLLYGPIGEPTAILARLPLARASRSSGQFVMRDSWNKQDATVVDFRSTPFISRNHQHLDANSFSLFYRTPLLLDSGIYDNYETVHWNNYYSRSIAHNTIVILDNPADDTSFGPYSNDGGQWLNGRQQAPTLEEITPPAGANVVGGITYVENQPGYAYAQGDASKAYLPGKLVQERGYLRDIVLLRNAGTQATVVVFDAVRTMNARKATALLHFQWGIHNQNAVKTNLNEGRTNFDFGNGPRVFTSRAGEAMITAQVLLPYNAVIRQAGGIQTDASNDCLQWTGNITAEVYGHDCRFTAPMLINGAWKWYNFAPAAPQAPAGPDSDYGRYRVEIEAAGVPNGQDGQFFLTVINPAANDQAENNVANVTPALLLASDANSAAVFVDSRAALIFNRAATQSTGYEWRVPGTGSPFLATGLVPNKPYQLTISYDGPTNSTLYRLQQGSGGTHTSSHEGTIAQDL